MTEETDLVRRAQARDEQAFEALVTRYAPRVWRLAVRMVGASDASDMVQQTFIAAWQALDRFRPEAAFAPWLLTIATHRCLNGLRSRKRSRLDSMEDEHFRLADPHAGPEGELEQRQRALLVQSAVQQLPPTSAAIVTLHYTEGLTCGEIGATLGMQESAVKVALFRARGKLREILKEQV